MGWEFSKRKDNFHDVKWNRIKPTLPTSLWCVYSEHLCTTVTYLHMRSLKLEISIGIFIMVPTHVTQATQF